LKSPYGLDILENCLSCNLKDEYLFCNLPKPALEMMESIRSTASYPKGAVLFVEGQDASGVYVLCQGRAKLSTSSAGGKTFILRISKPGDVLGLSSTVSGRPYDATAEIIEPSQVNHISRPDFLRFIAKHGDVALRVAQQLSNNYHQACEEVRSLSLSQNAAEKLARLLLDWSTGKGEHTIHKEGNSVKMRMTLTHEEIAQLIGSSRETVTRMMGSFKKKKLIEVKGSTLIVRDRLLLERMVDGQ
jgi:CRP/FNR family cyclic AMP-dependent transcriptional regulator